MPVLNQYRFQCWYGTDVQYCASTDGQLLANLPFGASPVVGRAYASTMPVPAFFISLKNKVLYLWVIVMLCFSISIG